MAGMYSKLWRRDRARLYLYCRIIPSFQHPEIIIVGLNPDLSHDLLSGMVDEIKKGKPFESGKCYSDHHPSQQVIVPA